MTSAVSSIGFDSTSSSVIRPFGIIGCSNVSEPKSQALVKAEETDRELVRRYLGRIADSPLNIQRGEAVVLDRHGVPHGRKAVDRRVAMYKVGIYGATIGGCVLAVSGAWAAGAALYLVGVMPTLAARYRGTRHLMAVELLSQQGQLDEAQRRLDAVAELRRRSPLYYAYIAGNLASHRGEYKVAIANWREASVRAKGITRERLKDSIARALVLSGQLAEGKLVAETVRFPPEADVVITGQVLTRALFALHDRESMPSQDELYEWTRKVLPYSHTGVELAAIAWLYERAGDDDLAALLAEEAPRRMHYPYLATWWPALQQWLDARTARSEGSGPA
jgi:hypothetical protein